MDAFKTMMKSVPHLSKADADQYAEDLTSLRREAGKLVVRDPWKSWYELHTDCCDSRQPRSGARNSQL